MKKLLIILTIALLTVACGSSEPLTPDAALTAFEEAGLECVNPEPIDKNNDSMLPKTWLEAFRCEVPSVNNQGVRVFSFENEADLNQVKAHYEALTGTFGSYVYVNENLLFQTSVDMSKDLAVKYEDAFMAIK